MTPAGCHRLTRNSGRGQWARWKVVITVASSSAQSQAGSHSPLASKVVEWGKRAEARRLDLQLLGPSSLRMGVVCRLPWILGLPRRTTDDDWADTHDLPQILVWSPHLPAWERHHARRRRCVTFCHPFGLFHISTISYTISVTTQKRIIYQL